MQRYYYGDSIAEFLGKSPDTILGALVAASQFSLEMTQRDAWLEQVELLQTTLQSFAHSGHVYFEYSIPRLGRRIDVVALIERVICVLEFKVNENEFNASAIDQVCDYALDLKNFHET